MYRLTADAAHIFPGILGAACLVAHDLATAATLSPLSLATQDLIYMDFGLHPDPARLAFLTNRLPALSALSLEYTSKDSADLSPSCIAILEALAASSWAGRLFLTDLKGTHCTLAAFLPYLRPLAARGARFGFGFEYVAPSFGLELLAQLPPSSIIALESRQLGSHRQIHHVLQRAAGLGGIESLAFLEFRLDWIALARASLRHLELALTAITACVPELLRALAELPSLTHLKLSYGARALDVPALSDAPLQTSLISLELACEERLPPQLFARHALPASLLRYFPHVEQLGLSAVVYAEVPDAAMTLDLRRVRASLARLDRMTIRIALCSHLGRESLRASLTISDPHSDRDRFAPITLPEAKQLVNLRAFSLTELRRTRRFETMDLAKLAIVKTEKRWQDGRPQRGWKMVEL